MRRGLRFAAALGGVMVAGLLVAADPAAAASARGCSGSASSVDDKGIPIDDVSAPGAGGTSSDPFVVDPDGPVSWDGRTDRPITNGSWKVKASFLNASGKFTNDDKSMTSTGSKKITDYVPAFLVPPGIYKVDVSVVGKGGTCIGSGYVKIDQNPIQTVWFGVAMLLIILAFILLLTGRPELWMVLEPGMTTPPTPGGED